MSPRKAGLCCACSPAAEVTLAHGHHGAGWVPGLSPVPGERAGARGTGAASARHSSSRRNVNGACPAAGSLSLKSEVIPQMSP